MIQLPLPALLLLFPNAVASLVFMQASKNIKFNRRDFLSCNAILAVSSSGVLNPPFVHAQEEPQNTRENKPYAPLTALLPATRLKLWVDEIYNLSQDMKSISDPNKRYQALQQINSKLSNQPKLFQGETENKPPALPPTAQFTTAISSVNKNQYQQNRKNLDLSDKLSAMLNQADVERQWGILQYSERKREQSNEMLAAFNFYTRQLTYGDEYLLTASREERKRMIRNDELPSLSSVIASDLDQRDLYRNEFLTAIDDAVAECGYQVRLGKEEVEVGELVDLVRVAYEACEKWFSMIAVVDVKEAVKNLEEK